MCMFFTMNELVLKIESCWSEALAQIQKHSTHQHQLLQCCAQGRVCVRPHFPNTSLDQIYSNNEFIIMQMQFSSISNARFHVRLNKHMFKRKFQRNNWFDRLLQDSFWFRISCFNRYWNSVQSDINEINPNWNEIMPSTQATTHVWCDFLCQTRKASLYYNHMQDTNGSDRATAHRAYCSWQFWFLGYPGIIQEKEGPEQVKK